MIFNIVTKNHQRPMISSSDKIHHSNCIWLFEQKDTLR